MKRSRTEPSVFPRQLLRQPRAGAEGLALGYIVFIAAAATLTGLACLLFPELGALSHDVITRPRGEWAHQPLRLALTPVLTAIIGTLVTRHLPYGVLSILLIVLASLLIIALLRSTIAPAISAGVLPLVLGVKTWMYPLGILFGVALLAGLLIVWRRYGPLPPDTGAGPDRGDVDDVLESRPRGKRWLVVLLLFVTVTGLAAQGTGLRFILFPPLIVMAYEMLGHPETCPWARRPYSFPVACLLTASGGLIAVRLLGTGPLAAGAAMAWGILVLRVFDVHMPPALAVALLPLVMHAPDMRYPVSVVAGTVVLTATFLVWRRWEGPKPAATSEAWLGADPGADPGAVPEAVPGAEEGGRGVDGQVPELVLVLADDPGGSGASSGAARERSAPGRPPDRS